MLFDGTAATPTLSATIHVDETVQITVDKRFLSAWLQHHHRPWRRHIRPFMRSHFTKTEMCHVQ